MSNLTAFPVVPVIGSGELRPTTFFWLFRSLPFLIFYSPGASLSGPSVQLQFFKRCLSSLFDHSSGCEYLSVGYCLPFEHTRGTLWGNSIFFSTIVHGSHRPSFKLMVLRITFLPSQSRPTSWTLWMFLDFSSITHQFSNARLSPGLLFSLCLLQGYGCSLIWCQFWPSPLGPWAADILQFLLLFLLGLFAIVAMLVTLQLDCFWTSWRLKTPCVPQ